MPKCSAFISFNRNARHGPQVLDACALPIPRFAHTSFRSSDNVCVFFGGVKPYAFSKCVLVVVVDSLKATEVDKKEKNDGKGNSTEQKKTKKKQLKKSERQTTWKPKMPSWS